MVTAYAERYCNIFLTFLFAKIIESSKRSEWSIFNTKRSQTGWSKGQAQCSSVWPEFIMNENPCWYHRYATFLINANGSLHRYHQYFIASLHQYQRIFHNAQRCNEEFLEQLQRVTDGKSNATVRCILYKMNLEFRKALMAWQRSTNGDSKIMPKMVWSTGKSMAPDQLGSWKNGDGSKHR